MIGNTDYWIHTRHNIDIVSLHENELIPIPFDFDYAGIINTPYAIPSAQLPIKTVKERFFKGSCKSTNDYKETIELFNDKKPSIIDLFNNTVYLDKKFKKTSVGYIEEFYDIINDPKKFSKYLVETCEFLNIPPDKAPIVKREKL